VVAVSLKKKIAEEAKAGEHAALAAVHRFVKSLKEATR